MCCIPTSRIELHDLHALHGVGAREHDGVGDLEMASHSRYEHVPEGNVARPRRCVAASLHSWNSKLAFWYLLFTFGLIRWGNRVSLQVALSCTIVSDKFRQVAQKLLQARYMKTLLLAGILVDTKNLSIGSTRDKQQATILLVGAGSLGRNGFYKHSVNIRDENYVTSFIREIYGDSEALAVEQSAAKRRGVEQHPKPMIGQCQESPPRSPKPSRSNKAEAESNRDGHGSSAPQARAPQSSKLSFSLPRLRARTSAAG